MRPGAEFPSLHGAPTAAAPANGTAAHSPWQSPVPYLFGGLAAMLGLIAFALLILACSYWKLSGYLDAGSGTDRDLAGSGADGDRLKGAAAGTAGPAAGFQEHVVVIMAGEERPTFLATPAASRAVVELGAAATTSVPGSTCGCSGSGENKKTEDDDGASSSQPRVEADAASSRSHESSRSSSTTVLQESSQ